MHIEVRNRGESSLTDEQLQPWADGSVLSSAGVAQEEWESVFDGQSRTKGERSCIAFALACEEIASLDEECREDGKPNALVISRRLAKRARDSFDIVLTGQAIRTLRERYRIGQELLDAERATVKKK